VICRFVAEHKARFGVAPICRALSAHGCQIAPRTYYAWARRAPSKRALWELAVTEVLAGYYEPDDSGRRRPEALYGVVKMWAHLNREGITVAKCTVERLMRANGWQGTRRARKVRTTIADPAADRAPDLVQRRFAVEAPNRLFVADFTYVRLASGAFVYTAFVIDAFAGRIVGWECSASRHTAFVERAVTQAVAARERAGHPLQNKAIHHSDAGSQYTSLHFTETLQLAGLAPSIGSVGDAYDNALAETTIGLYKTECIRDDSPFRTGPLRSVGDLEQATAAWVHWYNTRRLMHRLDRRPPAEAEADYHAQTRSDQPVVHT
jgi:putative transposase